MGTWNEGGREGGKGRGGEGVNECLTLTIQVMASECKQVVYREVHFNHFSEIPTCTVTCLMQKIVLNSEY